MAKRFSIETVFKGIDKMTAPVRKMQKGASKFTRGFSKGLRAAKRGTDALASGMKRMAAVGAVAFAVLLAGIVDISRVGSEFEQTMVTASAKFGIFNRHAGEGAKRFKLLETAARSMGTTTEFTAQQSAEALNFLAMAGFSAEQSVAALPGVLDLATAAEVELAQASDIATDSLGAFNLMTDDATQLQKNLTRVTDVLAATTNSANTNMEQMFEAMKDGGPVATAAGASIETFAALTGKLADAGIKGSKAGTTLKNMFIKLSAPTAGAAKILKKLGVQTKDSEGNLLDIVDIMDSLGKGLDGLGTADRAAVLDQVFGKRAIAGVNVLLGVGSQKLKDYREALENAGGSSKRLAATMRDTFGVEWMNLIAVIDDTKITIFELIKGPLKELFRTMKEWIINNKALFVSIGNAFKWLFDHPKLILTVAVVIGILTTALTLLIGTVSILSGVMTVFNFILAANPVVLIIGAIIAAVTLLIGIIAVAVIWWEEWTTWLNESSTWMKVLIGAVAFLMGPITFVIFLLGLFAKHWGRIKEEASIAMSFMKDKLKNMVDLFKLVGLTITNTWAKVTSAFKEMWTGVATFLSSLLNRIIVGFNGAIGKITSKIDKARGLLPEFAGGLSDEEIEQREAERQAQQQTPSGVLGPEAVMTREFKETKERSELTIRDETGRAELSEGSSAGLTSLNLINSGTF